MSLDPDLDLDLDAGVLRNMLGITDAAELARAEADFVTGTAINPFGATPAASSRRERRRPS